MDRWAGKVAVVTGASSGIGASVAQALARAGLTTVGLARRVDRIEALKGSLAGEAATRLHALKCDITKEEEILRAFSHICGKFGGVDILVNNAGISRDCTALMTGNCQDVREIFETNVFGLISCSKEAFASMKQRGSDGHIIHINSVAGHHVLDLPRQSVYSPSKFAVTALTESMRTELRNQGTKIKVTSISPGIVKTAILDGIPNVEQLPMLLPEDIASAVIYVLSTPPRVQIHELTIRPNGEPF